jgi:ribosomal protein L37AE/L43A
MVCIFLHTHSGGDKYSNMHCPNCSTQMQQMQRYDVDIDYCPSCKGVWLDRGEMDKIGPTQFLSIVCSI